MKSARVVLLLAALLLGGQVSALAQGFAWSRPLQRVLEPQWYWYDVLLSPARLSATDPQGNTYVAGTFRDSLTLAGTTVQAQRNRTNLFVARFDSSGILAWIRTGYSPDSTGAKALALTLDRTAAPLLLVQAYDSLTMGSVRQAGAYYLLSMNSAGATQWIRPIIKNKPWRPTFEASDLQVTSQGNILVVGQVQSVDSIAGLRAPFQLHDHSMLLRCDAAGRGQWLRAVLAQNSTGGVLEGRTRGDAAGNTYLSGVSDDASSVQINASSYGTFTLGYCAFLIQYDSLGTMRWYKDIPDTHGRTLGLDAASNVYWGGDTDPIPFNVSIVLDSVQVPKGLFVAKLSVDGQLQWLRGSDDPAEGVRLADMVTSPQGDVTILGHYRDTLSIGGYRLPLPDSADLLVAHVTSAGQTAWVETGGGADNDYGGTIGADAQGNFYLHGSTSSATGFGGAPLQATPAGSNGAFFLTKLRRHLNDRGQLTGTVYLDANANGQRDAGEPPFPRTIDMEERQSGQRLVARGLFAILVDTGAYDLRVRGGVPAYYALTQGSTGYQGRLGIGQADTARHFGVAPVANRPDVRVTLTPWRPARPGFTNRYRATIENVGTTTASGTVTLQFAPQLTYDSSQPAATSVAGNLVTWTYASLPPFGQLRFDAQLTLPASVPLGTALTSWASVTPLAGDLTPTDNADTLRQVVVGSYDPNDIAVNRHYLSPTALAAGQALDYTIRFQNTGTDTAFTVVIHDTLNLAYLAADRTQLLAASHTCTWATDPNGRLTVRFAGINLPRAGGPDSLASMGFVRFRIPVLPTLVLGDTIPNQAHIVFDFNTPVATNTAITIVGFPIPTGQTREVGRASWRLHPNPARGSVQVVAEAPATGALPVRLLDALGREVRIAQLTAGTATLDLRGLSPGLYVVRCGTTARQLVVE